MTGYEAFLQAGISLAPLGLEAGDRHSGYFCTPLGAEVIGWEGVDGIHCCFVEGFGEMVFAVNPMGLPGEWVHPIARNFEDLLRLLLSCGHLAPLEQAYGWDWAQFDQFLEENPPVPEQTAVLKRLKEAFSLSPMDAPYDYLRELQASFDYDRLTYSEECLEALPQPPQPAPPWRVTFESNFWGRYGRGHAGKEIPVDRTFSWGDVTWYVPAVYLCTAGIVVDLCARVPEEPIQAFLDKWRLRTEAGDFSLEERMQLETENPLNLDVAVSAVLNGKILRQKHGCGTFWVPVSCQEPDEASSPEVELVLDHYRLDRSYGWAIHRSALPWATRKKPLHVRDFRLCLERHPQDVPGPRFTVSGPGQTVPFTHPVTGEAHVLTVLDYEAEELDSAHFRDGSMVYPTHCATFTYQIEPELPKGSFRVQDCSSGDQPRPKEPSAQGDGPVAVFAITARSSPVTFTTAKAACSSLYFECPEAVQWRLVFRQKTAEDIELDLTEALED